MNHKRRLMVSFVAQLIGCVVTGLGAAIGVASLIRSSYGDGLMYFATGYVAASFFMILTKRLWERLEQTDR